MTIYTIMNLYEAIPDATFSNYHDLIVYVRRHGRSGNQIFLYELDNWNDFDKIKDISDAVYRDAYNGFEHYKDKNF